MDTLLRDIVPTDIPTIKPWLIDPQNAKWLDPFFQNESLRDEQLALFLMRREKKNYLIIYHDIPVGLIGLTDIDTINKSASIWSVLGHMSYRRKGITSLAYVLTLKKAFFELNLHSVNAWVADTNFSIRIFEKLGFYKIGRQRQCHMLDGILKDRILFDILHINFDEAALLALLK